MSRRDLRPDVATNKGKPYAEGSYVQVLPVDCRCGRVHLDVGTIQGVDVRIDLCPDSAREIARQLLATADDQEPYHAPHDSCGEPTREAVDGGA